MKNNILKLTATASLLTLLAGCGVHASTTSLPQTATITQISEMKISEQRAKEIAFQDAGVEETTVSDLTVWKDTEDGRMVYEVEFSVDDTHYDYTIDQQEGTILKQEKEIRKTKTNATKVPVSSSQNEQQSTTSSSASSTTSQQTTKSITKEQAKAIAMTDAGVLMSDAQLVKVEEEYERGQLIYEVEFYADGKEYDYEIAQSDGEILAKDYDIENWVPAQNDTSKTISLEEAKAIALEKVNGATQANLKIEAEHEDGQLIYEGEIHYQGMEYEFEIDGQSKAIIEWSEERDY